jgi:hypothetical protein
MTATLSERIYAMVMDGQNAFQVAYGLGLGPSGVSEVCSTLQNLTAPSTVTLAQRIHDLSATKHDVFETAYLLGIQPSAVVLELENLSDTTSGTAQADAADA